MIDQIRQRCVQDDDWATVRDVIVEICNETRQVVQLASKLRLPLQERSGEATLGPWTATATLSVEQQASTTTVEVVQQVTVTLANAALKRTETWRMNERHTQWQFLRTNPVDPRAVAALLKAVQALVRMLEANVLRELATLDDDPAYREARALIDAVLVSRTLAGETSP